MSQGGGIRFRRKGEPLQLSPGMRRTGGGPAMTAEELQQAKREIDEALLEKYREQLSGNQKHNEAV